MNQIGHQSRQPIDLIVRIAIVDGNVLPLDEACFLQALSERADKTLERRLWRAAEKTDHGNRALLRARGKRTRCKSSAAEKPDEIAPPHSLRSCGYQPG
jgi:hypothetical protein